MSSSKNSSDTSKNNEFSVPLKGFMVETKSPRSGWKMLVEGMGGERVRVHMIRIKK